MDSERLAEPDEPMEGADFEDDPVDGEEGDVEDVQLD